MHFIYVFLLMFFSIFGLASLIELFVGALFGRRDGRADSTAGKYGGNDPAGKRNGDPNGK